MNERNPGQRTIRFLLHNCVAHPIAGILWFLNMEKAGDAVHRLLLSKGKSDGS